MLESLGLAVGRGGPDMGNRRVVVATVAVVPMVVTRSTRLRSRVLALALQRTYLLQNVPSGEDQIGVREAQTPRSAQNDRLCAFPAEWSCEGTDRLGDSGGGSLNPSHQKHPKQRGQSRAFATNFHRPLAFSPQPVSYAITAPLYPVQRRPQGFRGQSPNQAYWWLRVLGLHDQGWHKWVP